MSTKTVARTFVCFVYCEQLFSFDDSKFFFAWNTHI